MQYQQTPAGLSAMFDSNVANGGGSIAATPSMMSLLGQQQGADQLTSMDNQRQYAYDTANDPLKLQEKGLQNDTLAEALPGVTARSKEDTRKASNGALLNDREIADHIGTYGAAATKRHIEDMEALGQTALQQSELSWANPMGANARAKQAFIDAGHGDAWNPEWDTMNAGDLADKLGKLGQGIQGTNAAVSKALLTAQAKGDAALAVKIEENRGKLEQSRIRAASADALTAAKERMASTKQTEQQYGTQMEALANAETDPAKKAEYMARANAAYKKAYELASAPAATGAAVKPDVGAMGIPKVGNPAAPTITGAQGNPPQAAPTAAQPTAGAASNGMPATPPPAGRVYVKDVRTGKVGHIPIGQLEDAMSHGYEMLNGSGARLGND